MILRMERIVSSRLVSARLLNIFWKKWGVGEKLTERAIVICFERKEEIDRNGVKKVELKDCGKSNPVALECVDLFILIREN